MQSLIAQLESATGPDRDLDAAIVQHITPCVVGIERVPLSDDALNYLFCFYPPRRWPDSWLPVPAYTASLDAAQQLVPAGWTWTAGRHVTGCGHAYIHNGELHFAGGGMTPNPRRRHSEVRATTPALALCIAALRARKLASAEAD